MQSERRDLEYFGKGLTDEQVVEKKRMLKESAEMHPEIAEYFRELAVDFCVRFPEEATRQRETKEWEQQESWRLAAAVPLTRAAVGLEEMWRCALSAVRALPHELLFCIGGEEATVWGVNKRKFLSASPRASLLYRW